MIDLYQHHQQDPETPLEETFGALEELVAEGTIRAYGTSNYEPEQLRARARPSRARVYVSEQSEYSWLERGAEAELLPTCERARPRLHPVLPARVGAAHRQGDARRTAGARARASTAARSSRTDLDQVERLRAWADAHGVTLLDVASAAWRRSTRSLP